MKASSFLVDREGCDKYHKEKEVHESKLKCRHLLLCTALPLTLLGHTYNDPLLFRAFDYMPRNCGGDIRSLLHQVKGHVGSRVATCFFTECFGTKTFSVLKL